VRSTPVVVGVCLGLLVLAVTFAFTYLRVRRNDQRWIVAQLQNGGAPVRVSVRYTAGTWDPRGVGKRIFAAGKATYTLDDSGNVHLHLQPKQGAVQDLVGPVPEPSSTKARRTVRALLIGYALALAVGFLLGFVLSGGTPGSRLIWGCIGIAVSMIAVWLATLAVAVGTSIRKLRRGN